MDGLRDGAASGGSARERFAAAVARPDADIDLGEAALLIAAEEYEGLDVRLYTRRLDDLAAGARDRLGKVGLEDPPELVKRFHGFLFGESGFHGNEDDYYDPRNSFLNEVLERKTGIPITLAAVYLEVARRVTTRAGDALPVRGIGFPGHFLARWEVEDSILVDPFYGSLLDEADCKRLLERVSGGKIAFKKELLAPLPRRGMLVRMLANLKGVWIKKGELSRAISAIDRILLLAPDAIAERRDRGLLWLKLECFGPALADLEAYLAKSPTAADARGVEAQVVSLRRTVSRIS